MLELFNSMRVIALPTKTNFRGINVREIVLFEGEFGWGEFSPFLEYSLLESVPWLLSAIAASSEPGPDLLRTNIKVNGTIPAINSHEKLMKIIESFPGCDTFKIKVGENLQEDLERISFVKSERRDAKIRIDVNGGWSLGQALENLNLIYDQFGEIEYVEQPCKSLEELRELKARAQFPLRIAGDEVLRKAKDPFSVKLAEAIDILVMKVQPLGGIERAKALSDHHGIPTVISSALESAVGISYGLKLAGSLPDSGLSAGLATGSLLSSDVALLPIVNGAIKIEDVTPNFESFEVGKDRREWWHNRVMQTWELAR